MDNRVRELRSERRWTQHQLAQRLNVSRQTVNALERGKSDPSLPLALKIAEIFGTAIEQVFVPRGRKPPVRRSEIRTRARSAPTHRPTSYHDPLSGGPLDLP